MLTLLLVWLVDLNSGRTDLVAELLSVQGWHLLDSFLCSHLQCERVSQQLTCCMTPPDPADLAQIESCGYDCGSSLCAPLPWPAGDASVPPSWCCQTQPGSKALRTVLGTVLMQTKQRTGCCCPELHHPDHDGIACRHLTLQQLVHNTRLTKCTAGDLQTSVNSDDEPLHLFLNSSRLCASRQLPHGEIAALVASARLRSLYRQALFSCGQSL